MSAKAEKPLSEFVPEWYYTMWAAQWNINLANYPYVVIEYDPTVDKRVPFAVFNFMMGTEEGEKVAQAVVIYKSLFSRSSFRRIIYF